MLMILPHLRLKISSKSSVINFKNKFGISRNKAEKL